MPRYQTFIVSIALAVLSLSALPAAAATSADSEDNAASLQQYLSRFKWLKGPATAPMKSVAQVEVPQGYMFADGETARTLLESMGNLTSDTEVGFLAPTSFVWFVVFRFSEDGYVKDDDKDKLDADKMLTTIKKGTEYGNKERKRLGLPAMNIIGWEQKPTYNPDTQNLEWAIRGESEGEQVINYNTRVLGRRGVMEVKLVVEPDQLQATLPEYKQLLTAYSFQSGQRYAEYRAGDKVAKYGLAALITGGAVAVAAKTGLIAWIAILFKKAGKLIVAAIVAIGVFFRRLIVGRSEPKTTDV